MTGQTDKIMVAWTRGQELEDSEYRIQRSISSSYAGQLWPSLDIFWSSYL